MTPEEASDLNKLELQEDEQIKKSAHFEYDSHDSILAHHSAGSIGRYVFPKDTILFHEGETRHCAYLIDKGEVHILGHDDTADIDEDDGEEKLLCSLGEGEIFGEMALIDDGPRTASAVTATETEVFVIPRNALHERMCGLDPIVSLLISILIERYRVVRIHLPESIKQDTQAGDFIKKISTYENAPENILRFVNLNEARKTARIELGLEQELRRGLERKEFIPVLQPILKLPERKIVGFEALIRWQHPEKGLLTPNHFIPVAERTNVVQYLDRLMLENACILQPRLNEIANTDEDLFISVNLSGINFETVDLVEIIKGVLQNSSINPANIKLEITESALIGDPEKAQKVLEGLKAMGLSIALDDFGTGYSSLGYLHKFPIDILKIDRSFVSQLHDDIKSVDIVRAIVNLAKNFKLQIVAEGIEREEDVTVLNSLQCDMGQGFLFSKPLSIEDARQFIRDNLSEST